jgi:hypothetical protein
MGVKGDVPLPIDNPDRQVMAFGGLFQEKQDLV